MGEILSTMAQNEDEHAYGGLGTESAVVLGTARFLDPDSDEEDSYVARCAPEDNASTARTSCSAQHPPDYLYRVVDLDAWKSCQGALADTGTKRLKLNDADRVDRYARKYYFNRHALTRCQSRGGAWRNPEALLVVLPTEHFEGGEITWDTRKNYPRLERPLYKQQDVYATWELRLDKATRTLVFPDPEELRALLSKAKRSGK